MLSIFSFFTVLFNAILSIFKPDGSTLVISGITDIFSNLEEAFAWLVNSIVSWF